MPATNEVADEPGWVGRMRDEGYKVTIGTGELPLEPEVDFFTPPFPLHGRPPTRMERLGRVLRKGFARMHHLVRRRGHAAVP
jgi:hypothetical protein